MASVLATQLAQLAGLKGTQEKWVRGKASLLFDYQRAADVGADTLLSIAQTGARVKEIPYSDNISAVDAGAAV